MSMSPRLLFTRLSLATRLPLATRLSLAACLGLGSSLVGCTETECATPDYTRAECRVLAENSFARLRSSTGVEARFQRPSTGEDDRASWSAEGLIVERGPKLVARLAHMGDFALSLRNTRAEPVEIELELLNLHPLAELETHALVEQQWQVGTKRSVSVTIPASGVTWVRGGLSESACNRPMRVAVLADVQDNPTQFARIIERLGTEAAFAEESGEIFLGAIFAGDLTERSVEDEFRVFTDLLDKSAVPFVLTPGNHDVYASHLPYYNQNFGPGNYEFNVCDMHVAMLDTGSGAIADSIVGRLPELFDRRGASYSLMGMHHPPHAAQSAAGWSHENLAMITLAEFAANRGQLVLAGHAHMLRQYELWAGDRKLREIITGTGGAVQGAGQPIFGYVRLSFPPMGTTESMPEADLPEIETCFVEVPPAGGPAHENTTSPNIAMCAKN